MRRRRTSLVHVQRGHPPALQRANEQSAIDLRHDALAYGRTIRLLCVIDVSTRAALAIEVDTSLPASWVVCVLDRLRSERPLPAQLVLDNGPELISALLEQGAHQHAVMLHLIDPGKPIQNAHCQSFHGRMRDECLNEHWFLGGRDAYQILEAWRQDYNLARLYNSLGYQILAAFAQSASLAAASPSEHDGLS